MNTQNHTYQSRDSQAESPLEADGSQSPGKKVRAATEELLEVHSGLRLRVRNSRGIPSKEPHTFVRFTSMNLTRFHSKFCRKKFPHAFGRTEGKQPF